MTQHRSLSRWLLSGLLILAIAFAANLVAPPAHADDPPTGIETVTVGADSITIAGVAAGAEPIDLYAIGAERAATIDDAEPAATATPESGRFTATVPRVAADGTDRITSQFVAAVAGTELGAPHFADRFDYAPANPDPLPTTTSKKGLQVQLTDDAEALGIQHAALNLDLADIMLLDSADPDTELEFDHDGASYSFDAEAVAAFDQQIKPLTDDGILVHVILLLYRHPGEPNSADKVLIHPDASTEPGAGPVFGFNTETAEGVRYLNAALAFVAERYGRADHRYGLASGYVVGNEVNAQWTWSNSGEKTLAEFVDLHERAVRLVSLATKSAFRAARTYLSLEHHWTLLPPGNPDPERPTRTYRGRDLVEEFNRVAKRGGDFDWQVAFHPYPENLFEPDFWNDETATGSPDTQRITFKNIEVLPEFLDAAEFRFQDQPRRIILSEQGCNTPGQGDALTEASERLQAACYALAYYKIKFLPSIDSFILHRHVDHRQEGGLNLGLWAADHSVEFPAAPLRTKAIYDVFAGIDTARSEAVTEFALPIIGIDDWSVLVDGFDPDQLADRTEAVAVPSRVGGELTGVRPLGRFVSDTDGWQPSNNAESATAGGGMLKVDAAGGTFGLQARGVVRSFDRPLALTGKRWLGATVRVPADAGLGDQVVVRLRATLDDGMIITGDARIPADGTFHPAAIAVPDDPGRLSRLKVLVAGTGTGTPDAGFDVGSVVAATGAAPSEVPNVTATAMVDRAELIGAELTVSLRNLDLDPLSGPILIGDRCGDFVTDPAETEGDGTEFGESQRITTKITAVSGADPSTVCLTVAGHRINIPVDIPPPTEHTVIDFENDLGGFAAGPGVSGVARVGSFANAPGRPRGGAYALEATSETVPGDQPRTVTAQFDQPLDLSEAGSVHLWMNSYGGLPGAAGYRATLTLHSSDGSKLTGALDAFTPDRWNQVSVDVADWSGRSSITGAEVTFAGVGSDTPWQPRFQLDDLGWFAG
ncbi:DUF5722 domain-containing protein [Microlunatus speluncae]|uniref:DUF5722 domain-containing protein n=1 Tax=Microlunatus speluncae TaxID=2594267 RepID=UPI0013759605|nr:DUF5722 domain-containing protein [Microlunatus speluncae]